MAPGQLQVRGFRFNRKKQLSSSCSSAQSVKEITSRGERASRVQMQAILSAISRFAEANLGSFLCHAPTITNLQRYVSKNKRNLTDASSDSWNDYVVRLSVLNFEETLGAMLETEEGSIVVDRITQRTAAPCRRARSTNS
jgi:hypothetical protein